MKELIGAALIITSIVCGSAYAAREIHFRIRLAAIEKISEGIRELPKFSRDAKK